MPYVLAAYALLAVLAHAWLARQERGTLVGLALHPFNVIGLLTTVVTIDFITLYNDTADGRISELLGYMIATPRDVTQGAIFFMLCSLAMVAGVVVAAAPGLRPTVRPLAPETARAEQVSASIVMAVAAACTVSVASVVVVASIAEGSIVHVAGLRQAFFRDNQALAMLSGIGIPAFYLYGSRVGVTRSTVLYALLLVACLLPIGSRSSIVFLALGLAFWWSQSHSLRISYVYVGLVPLAVLSTFYRYLTRDANMFASYWDFIDYHGGYFGVLFRSPDVSLAEGMTAAITQATILRGPFDSLLAAAMAPIPRSWIPWKPFSASAEFTRNATPEHFELFGSSWTVTGFVNLFLEYGYWLSIPVAFVLAWIWARIWIAGANRRTSAGLAGPVLILIAYTFYRADLYDVALFLWPLGAVLLLHFFIRRLVGGSTGSRRAASFGPGVRDGRTLPRGR